MALNCLSNGHHINQVYALLLAAMAQKGSLFEPVLSGPTSNFNPIYIAIERSGYTDGTHPTDNIRPQRFFVRYLGAPWGDRLSM